jgi:predicted enzyme related to lactoylglutathione lyase
LFKGDGPAPERPAPGAVGFVGWNELVTNEGASAFGFYQDIFGWRKSESYDMGPMGMYQTFSTNAVLPMSGGMMNLSKDAAPTGIPGLAGPHWLYYFTVDDIRTAVERVKAGGGKITHGPSPVPGGSWIVQAQDPQGGFFAMSSAKG